MSILCAFSFFRFDVVSFAHSSSGEEFQAVFALKHNFTISTNKCGMRIVN